MYFWSTHSSLLVMTLVIPYFGERIDNIWNGGWVRKDLRKKWDFSTLLCGQFDLSEIDDTFRRSEISLQNEVQDFYFVYANVVYLQ